MKGPAEGGKSLRFSDALKVSSKQAQLHIGMHL